MRFEIDPPEPQGPADRPEPETPRRLPWQHPELVGRLVFVHFTTLGPDPATDGLVRVEALFGDSELQSRVQEITRPDGALGSRATRRVIRELAISTDDLERARPAAEAVRDLAQRLEGKSVVTSDAKTFAAYFEALTGHGFDGLVLDVPTLRSWLAPTRAGRAFALDEGDKAGALQLELVSMVARLGDLDPSALAVFAHMVDERLGAEEAVNPRAADTTRTIASLVEHPHRFTRRPGELFEASSRATAGLLSDAVRAYHDVESALEAAVPGAVRPQEAPDDDTPLPVSPKSMTPKLSPEDQRRVDEIFEAHLPMHFANQSGGEARVRTGQHTVARGVAEAWGGRKLHLIHAPTGTGKTLAYLVPTMLWALRNRVRVAVATYTRALQEQAIDRDVPLALQMLERTGIDEQIRVAPLKGRANYVCWRALRAALPEPEESSAHIGAWLHLAMFAFLDPEGDLDRLRGDGTATQGEAFVRARKTLATSVRAQVGCCSHAADRKTCCAELARRRAERSHVVVTNHALALARRDLFKRFVFDECEHLHDVAHGAFSHGLPLPNLKRLIDRTGSGSRSVLGRLARRAPRSASVHGIMRQANEVASTTELCFVAFEDEVVRFADWRDREARDREDATTHSLFREYFAARPEAADDLTRTHRDMAGSLDRLVATLARIAEHLDAFPVRGVRRLRRSLDLSRADLSDALDAVVAWIPKNAEGEPSFRQETFYDLERNVRDEDVLAARVLLPHEYLGRRFWPDLDAAVLLSATTWLKGGFEASSNYLGLTRAANPADDEDREPCEVVTLRVPEAFDYGRVLIAVPRDAPVPREKRRWLEYCARSIAFVAERARGRTLALFTNADDVREVGRRLTRFFDSRHLPLLWQGMPDVPKEELSDRFRERVDSTLLGLDTFWFGADFPGETLEYLFLARLPYGVPDRYYQAQCAVLGPREQRRQIYMPRALAKFRQGFGRLLRSERDRGVCFVMDKRILEPRHRSFLRELPLEPEPEFGLERGAELLRADGARAFDAAFAHIRLTPELERRGFDGDYHSFELGTRPARAPLPPNFDVDSLPF